MTDDTHPGNVPPHVWTRKAFEAARILAPKEVFIRGVMFLTTVDYTVRLRPNTDRILIAGSMFRVFNVVNDVVVRGHVVVINGWGWVTIEMRHLRPIVFADE